MKSTLRLANIFLLSFLVVFVGTLAVYAVDIYEVVNIDGHEAVFSQHDGGRMYIGGVDPTYDETSQSIDVTGVAGQVRSVPSVNADGTISVSNKIIGNEVVEHIPGTDIVKLADGTYTNGTPSQTLLDAADEAATPVDPTYDGHPFHRCQGDGSGYYDCGSGNKLQADSYFEMLNAQGTRVDFRIALGSIYDEGVGGQAPFGTNNTFFGGVFRYVSAQLPSYYNGQKMTSATVTYDQTKLDEGTEGELTAETLLPVLQPLLPDYLNNGIKEDLEQSGNLGGGTTTGTAPTGPDIDGFLKNIYDQINGDINTDMIGPGIGSGTPADDANIGGNQQLHLDNQQMLDGLKKLTDSKAIEDDPTKYPTEGSMAGKFSGDFEDPGEADSLADKLTDFSGEVQDRFPGITATAITPSGASSVLDAGNFEFFGAQIPLTIDFAPFGWVITALGLIINFFAVFYSFYILIGRG